MTIGFVILSHKHPHQLLRLTRTLTALYGAPPIVCHHDFSQSGLDATLFPPNVTFVDPSIRTGWGKWSLVAATIAGIRALYARADPDWFTLLSAADYPVMAAGDVLSDLETTAADVLMDHRPVPPTGTPAARPGSVTWLSHHGSAGNIELARDRYLRATIKYPIIRRTAGAYSTSVQDSWRIGRQTIALPFQAPSSPFRKRLQCYVGSQWLTANRRAAQLIVRPDASFAMLRDYLRRRIVPDETFFQSLFCNHQGLRIDPNPRRYAQWGDGGAHPHDLTVETIGPALTSGAHFARKFAPESPALDQLDKLLLG